MTRLYKINYLCAHLVQLNHIWALLVKRKGNIYNISDPYKNILLHNLYNAIFM